MQAYSLTPLHHLLMPAGKYWCWVFWQFDVQTVEFARASEVLVRAWDSSMNTQPSHLTWNLMGMMNNCHFRIKLHQHVDEQVGGQAAGLGGSRLTRKVELVPTAVHTSAP